MRRSKETLLVFALFSILLVATPAERVFAAFRSVNGQSPAQPASSCLGATYVYADEAQDWLHSPQITKTDDDDDDWYRDLHPWGWGPGWNSGWDRGWGDRDWDHDGNLRHGFYYGRPFGDRDWHHGWHHRDRDDD